LRPVLEGLGAATPFLFEEDVSVEQWVQRIPFQELAVVDEICEGCHSWSQTRLGTIGDMLRVAPEKEVDERSRQRLATQLALRIHFVLDLARFGPPSVRTSIPWSGDVVRDLRHLLIVHWRQNALWWASTYGQRHMRPPPPA
jgi:hypothetical protein